MDYYFKWTFQKVVVRMDYDVFRQDFPPTSDEEPADDEYDEIYDSTCVSSSIVTIAEEDRGVWVFRIAVKTSDLPSIAMGESKFSFGEQSLTPNLSGMNPLRYYWNVSENVMIENQALIFTPDDYLERIENAWLSSNNGDENLEFLWFVVFDASCLRFDLNNTVLPKKFFFKRNEPFEFVSTSMDQLRLWCLSRSSTVQGNWTNFVHSLCWTHTLNKQKIFSGQSGPTNSQRN